MSWNCHLYYLWEGTNSSCNGRNSAFQSLQHAYKHRAAHQQVLCLIRLLPFTYLVRCMCWKAFLGTQNDKCISFISTPSVICVFFSLFSSPKGKKGFHPRWDRCCMSLQPQCHLEQLLRLLLSTLCLCGRQFTRVMNLSSICKDFPVYCSCI